MAGVKLIMPNSSQLEELVEKVRNKGYKLTEQRRDIIETLLKYCEEHFTAEELHRRVREINPEIGLSTIYRNMELLSELGIVKKLNFAENEARYELVISGGHHHHMICLHCGKIIEFSSDYLEKLEEGLESSYNFEMLEHYIKLFGSCRECQH